jgi:hypothetical protein
MAGETAVGGQDEAWNREEKPHQQQQLALAGEAARSSPLTGWVNRPRVPDPALGCLRTWHSLDHVLSVPGAMLTLWAFGNKRWSMIRLSLFISREERRGED